MAASEAARGTGPEGPRLDLDRYVPALITFLANKLSTGANALYQRRFGISVTEWRILSLLALEPGIPAARICQVIGFDKGPVSRTLKLMERRGMVAIRAGRQGAGEGGRRHAISLTQAGLAAHDAVIEIALDRERRLLACLAPEEREQLAHLLRRLHGNLDALAADRPVG